jgi:hypothetical protein
MVFGLVVFVADRLSDCRYLSRCCSPLDSQRVRCGEGLAMKSFSDRPFRVNAIPRHRGCVLVHRSLRRVPRPLCSCYSCSVGIGHQRAGAMSGGPALHRHGPNAALMSAQSPNQGSTRRAPDRAPGPAAPERPCHRSRPETRTAHCRVV